MKRDNEDRRHKVDKIDSAKNGDLANIKTMMDLTTLTQPNSDTNEETKRLEQVRLTEDFMEQLKNTTNIPLRHMTLNDPERCPVQFISGMIKSKQHTSSKDEATKEYNEDNELVGCDTDYADDEISNSQRAENYRISGDTKIADRDFQGAFEDLSEAIRLDPQNYRCYGLRGVTHYELGRYEEAIEDESISINSHPDRATLYNRAEAYYKTGKDTEAIADLDHALKLASEGPSDDTLIPEIHKLAGIIKDKSLNREDYYQAPIGWEKESQSPEPDYEELDDVGPEVIQFVHESMYIDEGWSVNLPRGFVWWGHRLAQKVWADDCRKDENVDVTLMHVETDFLRNVKDTPQIYESINELNAGVSQFAFIYYPKDRCIRLHSTVYTHGQNLNWSERLFLKAVSLQVSHAERMAECISHLFTGSEPDTTPHPDRGFRQKKDEMVDVSENFFIPMGKQAPPIASGIFQSTKELLRRWFMAESDDDGLTAEFPFTGNEPALVRITQGKHGVVTSFFVVNSVEEHPLLGRGLLMRMMLPITYTKERGLQLAMSLNRLESTEWVKGHLTGAWCVDDQCHLMFVSFYPIAGLKHGELINLALSFAARSKWAGEVLAETDANHHGATNRILN